MRIFNLIRPPYTPKERVGFVGVKGTDNLLYENRNGTGLLSFLQKINLKYFFKIHYLLIVHHSLLLLIIISII